MLTSAIYYQNAYYINNPYAKWGGTIREDMHIKLWTPTAGFVTEPQSQKLLCSNSQIVGSVWCKP